MTTTKGTQTPGPWEVSPDGVCVVSADAVYQTHTENGKEYQHPDKLIALPYGCAPGSREANARLIASAPDLLAVAIAVEKAARHAPTCADNNVGHMRGRGCNCYVAAARAAIAKAEGR